MKLLYNVQNILGKGDKLYEQLCICDRGWIWFSWGLIVSQNSRWVGMRPIIKSNINSWNETMTIYLFYFLLFFLYSNEGHLFYSPIARGTYWCLPGHPSWFPYIRYLIPYPPQVLKLSKSCFSKKQKQKKYLFWTSLPPSFGEQAVGNLDGKEKK